MGVGDIASVATSMSEARTQTAVGVTVLRKSMDIDQETAAALIGMVSTPPTSAAGTYPIANIGQNINITA